MTLSLRAIAASFTIAFSLLFSGYFLGQAHASPQPRLQAALAHLRAARGSLEKGVPDRSGHRGQGIGTALVRRVEAALAALGCLKVNLQVRACNDGVVRFYERIGYDVEERVSMGKRLYE